MTLCPRCRRALERVHDARGEGAACTACGGRALTFPDLQTGLPAEVAASVATAVRAKGPLGVLPCPTCDEPMRELDAGGGGPPVLLRGCASCRRVWLDADGVERLSTKSTRRKRVRPQSAAEAIGMMRLQRGKDAVVESEVSFASGDGIAGFLELPTLHGRPRMDTRPIATYALAGALLATSIILFAVATSLHGFLGASALLRSWLLEGGFVPADPWRHGGATWITNIFLHGSVLHLVINVYVLVLAGRDVESRLGRGRFLALFFLADVGANLLEMGVNGASTLPRVGASGGISGVFAFYAFAMPSVDLGLYFPSWRTGTRYTFTRLRVPVPWAFGGWMLLQLFGALGSRPHVAFVSHVGGALSGIAYWAWSVRAARHRGPVSVSLPPASPLPAPGSSGRGFPPTPPPVDVETPDVGRDLGTSTSSVSELRIANDLDPIGAPGARSPAGVDVITTAGPVDLSVALAEPARFTQAPISPRDDERPRPWRDDSDFVRGSRRVARRIVVAVPVLAVATAAFAFVCNDTSFMGALGGMVAIVSAAGIISGMVLGHAMATEVVRDVRGSTGLATALTLGACLAVTGLGMVLGQALVPFQITVYAQTVGASLVIGSIVGSWSQVLFER